MFFMRARFLSTAVFLAALLFSLPSLAASRCDVNVPTERVDLEQVSLAYQSIGRASDPALLLVMGLGGQLIHWPDEVVVALCQQGFRVIRYDNRDVGLSTWRQTPVDANLTFEVLRYKLGLPVSAPYTLTDMADDAFGLDGCLARRAIPRAGREHGRDDRPAYGGHGTAACREPDAADDQLGCRRLAGAECGAGAVTRRDAGRRIAKWRWSNRPICWRRWAARR